MKAIRSCVKHFAAYMSMLLVGVLILPSIGYSQARCEDAFVSERDIFDLDDKAARKATQHYLGKYGESAPLTVEVENGGIKRTVWLPSDISKRMDPVKNLNIAFMGVLGKLFDFVQDPKTGKIQRNLDHDYAREVRAETEAILSRSKPVSREFLEQLGRIIHFEKTAEGNVFVRIGSVHFSERDALTQAISGRFQILYINLANWVYRSSGLEKNSALANATMTDEIVSMARMQRAFEYQMIFDKNIWDTHVSILETYVKDYQAAKDPAVRKEILDKISKPAEPLLPAAGVATLKHFIYSSLPFEIKRYFKNDLEDPLGFTKLEQKNEYALRHQMLYKTIEGLPPQTSLEVRSHTPIHTRAYSKLGFADSGVIQDSLYAGVEVHLLKAKRETVLEKITAILDSLK